LKPSQRAPLHFDHLASAGDCPQPLLRFRLKHGKRRDTGERKGVLGPHGPARRVIALGVSE
jgi:hypothetical protein